MQTTEQKCLWPGWETVTLLGQGSFGAVYEVCRPVFGELERAAIKCITIPQSENEIRQLREDGYDEESITGTYREQLKSIITEYSMMRKLNGSSNVVSCDDVRYVQHSDGIGWDIYIKMELLTPLSEALGESVTEETVLRIGSDLCRALVLCRKNNIIHRDIKPGNIFVSPNGDYKLGDFGVARTMERTSGGTKIGTYEYMAPEVFRGMPYGSTVDIYSLGLVLYWLLNERRGPFLPLPPMSLTLSGREMARERRFRGEALPPPAHGSKALKSIVLKACAAVPELRYQTAEEMLEDLESLRSGRSQRAFSTGEDRTATIPFDAGQNRPQTVYGPPYGTEKERKAALEERRSGASSLHPGERDRGRSRDGVGLGWKLLAIGLALAGLVIGALALHKVLAAKQSESTPDPTPPAEAAEETAETETPAATEEPMTEEEAAAFAQAYLAEGEVEADEEPPEAEALSVEVSLQSPEGLSRVSFVSALASSEFYQSDIRTTFYANGAISGTGNPWVEGVDGPGIGEWLRLYFPQEESVRYLSLRLGFASTEKLYRGNNRPSRLLLSFSDGSSVECDFPDLNTPMLVSLSEPVTTSYVQLTILDVYYGDVDNDTCILLAAAYR